VTSQTASRPGFICLSAVAGPAPDLLQTSA